MNRAYVDANVIVRLITGDPPDLAERAARLFRHMDDGELELVVEEIVVAETVWVLSSFYGFSPDQIAPVLRTFLISDRIISDGKLELLQALALYEDKNVDFVNALIAAKMMRRGVPTIYSFDNHFDRFDSIRRLTPE